MAASEQLTRFDVEALINAHHSLEASSGRRTVKNLLRTPDGTIYGIGFDIYQTLRFVDVNPANNVDGMPNGTMTYWALFPGRIDVSTLREGRYRGTLPANDADIANLKQILTTLNSDRVEMIGKATFTHVS